MISEKRKQVDEEKKMKTKNNLLRAAIDIFVDKGYHKTNISDIVAKAEVGQGTFYRNFNSKREIFENILKILIGELLSEFSEGVLNVNNMPSSFEEYKKMSTEASIRAVPIIKRNKDIMILFFRDAPTIDKEFEQEVNDILEQFLVLGELYLKHAIKEGFARKCNTRIVAESIVGIATSLLKSWLYGNYKDSEVEDIVVEINNFVFLGVSSLSKEV
jgi:AcrR family transcriptional regulator